MNEENKKQPVQKIRVGSVTATIWENKNDEGNVFHTVQIVRNYKKGEEWQTTNSYGRNDLPKLQLASQKAFEYLAVKQEEKE